MEAVMIRLQGDWYGVGRQATTRISIIMYQVSQQVLDRNLQKIAKCYNSEKTRENLFTF